MAITVKKGSVTTNTYSVSGDTLADIWSDIQKNGPKHKGSARAGKTTCKVKMDSASSKIEFTTTQGAKEFESEAKMTRYQNANYPVVVAVCEDRNGPQNVRAQQAVTPPAGAEAGALPAPADQAAVPAPPEAPAPAASASKADGITVRTIAMLKRHLPDRAAIRDTVTKPFRYAENGYSWVVRKFVAE